MAKATWFINDRFGEKGGEKVEREADREGKGEKERGREGGESESRWAPARARASIPVFCYLFSVFFFFVGD